MIVYLRVVLKGNINLGYGNVQKRLGKTFVISGLGMTLYMLS